MITTLITHAPIAGLLFFFCVFLGITIWALRPANKAQFQGYSMIPLREDSYGK